jgi:hypothetical protein
MNVLSVFKRRNTDEAANRDELGFDPVTWNGLEFAQLSPIGVLTDMAADEPEPEQPKELPPALKMRPPETPTMPRSIKPRPRETSRQIAERAAKNKADLKASDPLLYEEQDMLDGHGTLGGGKVAGRRYPVNFPEESRMRKVRGLVDANMLSNDYDPDHFRAVVRSMQEQGARLHDYGVQMEGRNNSCALLVFNAAMKAHGKPVKSVAELEELFGVGPHESVELDRLCHAFNQEELDVLLISSQKDSESGEVKDYISPVCEYNKLEAPVVLRYVGSTAWGEKIPEGHYQLLSTIQAMPNGVTKVDLNRENMALKDLPLPATWLGSRHPANSGKNGDG